MFKNILKLIELFKFQIKYPDVIIIGGPFLLRNIFGWRNAFTGFFSQEGQDSFLFNEFFKKISKEDFPKRFLDVGCNHPIHFNNSYFFERFCNFDVLAIDPLDTYKKNWEETRPGTKFEMCAVGASDGSVEFDIAIGDGIESMYSSVLGKSNKNKNLKKKTHAVKVRTIKDLLSSNNWDDVGIMSMDIEGYEKEALLGIDFKKIKIRLIIIENNSNSLFGECDVRNILSEAGYVFYGRFWGLDDLFVHTSMLEKKT